MSVSQPSHRSGITAADDPSALQAAFEALPWSVAVLDEEGTIIAVNQAWRQFLTRCGVTLADDGVGTSYLRVCEEARGVGPEDTEVVAEAIRDLLLVSTAEHVFEYSYNTHTEERWYLVRLRGGEVNGRRRITAVHQDVTDRRNIEAARKVVAHRELEALVDARTRDLRRANQRLRDAQRELTESELRLRELTTRLFTAQEDERRRLAREFHDSFGQQIAAISIQLGSLRQRNVELVPDIRKHLADIQDQIVNLSNDLRRVSHELHPAALEQLGLQAALRAHCESFGSNEQIAVDFDGAGCPSSLRDDVATCLFRVTQTALHNVARHAGAQHALVRVAGSPGTIELRIVDDGKGFDVSEARQRAGLGLVSMEERVRMLGGRLQVTSVHGKGTTVKATMPVPLTDV